MISSEGEKIIRELLSEGLIKMNENFVKFAESHPALDTQLFRIEDKLDLLIAIERIKVTYTED